jgi:hypothetical protein
MNQYHPQYSARFLQQFHPLVASIYPNSARNISTGFLALTHLYPCCSLWWGTIFASSLNHISKRELAVSPSGALSLCFLGFDYRTGFNAMIKATIQGIQILLLQVIIHRFRFCLCSKFYKR